MNVCVDLTLISTFKDLTVDADIEVKGNKIFFSLIKGNSYLAAVVDASEVTGSMALNNSSDPQDEVDVNFDKLEVSNYNIAKVEDVDGVYAVIGQPFVLTHDQVLSLNFILEEHFVDCKLNEFLGAA